jgi:tryptophan synthase alpha chain
MHAIAAASSGYLYLDSSLGTTGAKSELPADLPDLIHRAKNASGDLPVAVGFGVSRREHASQIVAAGADGVIVGSALLGNISQGGGQQGTSEFVRDLRRGCSRSVSESSSTR